ncbi:hypothetical protein [Microbacterium sp. E-13]|uniref:hypothetical protein n=1 Tax=Microbacterium sp. E-13 TaxID=3404048 RepID=UPI003CF4022B
MRVLKLGTVASAIAVAAALVFSAGGAYAAPKNDKPGYDDLTAEQKQGIAAWEAPQAPATVGATTGPAKGSAAPAAKTADSSVTLAATSWSSRTSLYRGSWVMWANEHVDFGSNTTQVTWSSGYQDCGWVFPNNVTKLGTSRIANGGWYHKWRGGYRVGAGVPTPWGNVNVYSMTSYATTQVMRGNGWTASWNN